MPDLSISYVIVGTPELLKLIRPGLSIEEWPNSMLDIRTYLSQDIGWTKLSFDVFKADLSPEEAVEVARSGTIVLPDIFQRLEKYERVSELWPEGFKSSRVHLVLEKSTRPDYESRPDSDWVNQMIETREQTVKHFQYLDVISHDSEIANLIKTQEGNHYILNGRPVDKSALPISLYHQVFYKFAVAATRPPSPQYIAKAGVFDFICACRGLYEDRHERFRGLEASFDNLLGVSLKRLQIPETSEDGVVATHNGAYTLINEWRNEIGVGGSDPFIASATTYKRYWSQDSLKKLRDACCCPSFILIIAGPWICVQGAITTNSDTIIQPLTDFVWMGPRHFKADGVQEAGQIFEALSSSLKSLHSFYDNLALVPQQCRSFPWINYFPDKNGYNIQFRYTGVLKDVRSVFRAETIESSPRQIVVKFTPKYHGDAHRLLAVKGYAPELLFESSLAPSFPRPGDLVMVVTEFVPEAPLSLAYAEAYETLSGALDILHSQGLVFGDLRPPNVLVPATRPDQAMLVDFDWCGVDGKDCYPWDINMKGVEWVRGVGPGKVMYQAHDEAMFERMMELFD